MHVRNGRRLSLPKTPSAFRTKLLRPSPWGILLLPIHLFGQYITNRTYRTWAIMIAILPSQKTA